MSEELLGNALDFAKQRTSISDSEVDTILHARKSLLFSAGSDWGKKSKNGLFDVSMGSYDGAEVYELVRSYALASLPAKYKRRTSDCTETTDLRCTAVFQAVMLTG